MADKKFSILLSAKEQVSQAFQSAEGAAEQLREQVAATNRQIKELGDTAARTGDYDKLGRAFAQTKQQLAGARKEASAAATDLAKLTAAQEQYKKELAAAERQLQKMTSLVGPVTPQQQEAIAAQTRKVNELRAAYDNTGKAVREAEKQQRTATGEARKLTDQLGSQGRRLGSLAGDLQKAGINTKALGAEQLRLRRETEQATKAMERQQGRLRTISDAQSKMQANKATRGELAGQAMGLAASIAPAAYAMKKAIDYESAFAGVTKVVNFSSPEEQAKARQQMMELAGKYGVNQVGMTNIVSAAGEAGIGKRADGTTDVKELMRFAGDASRMSVAMDMSSEEAGSTIAKWRSAMGMNQDQAMRLADYANAVSNEMAAKPAEVARVMLRQGATTMKAGFTDRQAAALAASLIAGGEGEETTATAMKNITGRLGKGFAATGSQKTALTMLGFNPEVLAKDMQKDAAGTLFKVLEQIGKQSKDKQAPIISQLFGEEVVGAVSKLSSNTQLLKTAMRLAGDEAAYAGSMEMEYQNKARTRQAMIDRNSAQMERLTIAVGDMLLPILDQMVPPITALAEKGAALLETSQSARDTVGWLVKAGAALVGLKAFHLIAKGIGSMFSDAWQMGRIMKARLGGAVDQTTSAAGRAAAGLARVNSQLNRMGGATGPIGGRGGARSTGRAGRGSRLGGLIEAEERIASRSRSRSRMRGAGKWAGLLGLGAGISMLPAGATAAEMTEEMADVGGGARSTGRAGRGSRLGGLIEAEERIASRSRSRSRMRGAGKWAGLLGLGAGISMLPAGATAAEMTEDVADMGGGMADLVSAVRPMSAVGQYASKAIRPLGLIADGAHLVQAATTGNAVSIGGAAGDMVGSIGGGWAGAAAGAAMGSVVPVIGTAVGAAVGGALGSWGGGELGNVIGEKFGSYFKDLKEWWTEDKTKVVPKDPLTQQLIQNSNKQETSNKYDIKINVAASGDPQQDNALAAKIRAQLASLLQGSLNSSAGMDVRVDGSLAGLGSD